jgi:hypothetical protein
MGGGEANPKVYGAHGTQMVGFSMAVGFLACPITPSSLG